MMWVFVDYENVGSLARLDLSKYERLIVFCGPRHKRLNIGDIPSDFFTNIELIRMESTAKNNLDFHLSFYLGLQHRKAASDVKFHILADDKGYDGLISHMNKLGRDCRRLPSVAKKKVTKKKSASPKTPTQGVVEQLRKRKSSSRPHKRSALLNWIESNTKNGNQKNARQIFGNLEKAGWICVDGESISYDDAVL